MHIAVTGASGLVGSQLLPALRANGHSVVPIGRGVASAGGISWDPQEGILNSNAFAGIDAVVHLAGENIGAKRWSKRQKNRIMESRTSATSLLARTLAALPKPPSVFISASAVGLYGDLPGGTVADEGAQPGEDFLAQVYQAWEAAAEPARSAGIRVVHPRFGIVLSGKGGALKRMLLPFRLGLGGPMGGGRQSFPWVAMDDVVGAIMHCLQSPISGPVNVTAPERVNQREFAKALGAAMHRPSFAPLPGFIVRLMFGEMGTTLLLAGQHASPTRLIKSGYKFTHPALEGALHTCLARARN